MSEAVCTMNNCRRRAPPDEPFCYRHRTERPDYRGLLLEALWYVREHQEAKPNADTEDLLRRARAAFGTKGGRDD